jgi:DNA-binding transcriptional LysR family regulator
MPDTLLNMKAFLATARGGSFSQAARQIGVATSVITKRVNQLEWALNAKLFVRTTRTVKLTEMGERYLTSIRDIVGEYDDMVAGIRRSPGELEGHVRIKAPVALSTVLLGKVFATFQRDNPRITLDVVLNDRSVNPVEEGFDIVLGIAPASYDGVIEEPLHVYPRFLCAAPSYLKRRGTPEHPRDLVNHDCLAFSHAGNTWTFQSGKGSIHVTVKPRFVSSDSSVLVTAACEGNGIMVASKLAALPALNAGKLVPILPDYPIPDLWLRAMVPQSRIGLKRIQALMTAVRESLLPAPPWEVATAGRKKSA